MDKECGARWTEPVVDLGRGRVHLCCKTTEREVDEETLDRLQTDVFLNNPYVIERRLEMARGEMHSDCGACWKAESLGFPSPRSPMEPVLGHVDLVSGRSSHARQITIELGNTCDLKCVYCSRNKSSSWAAEDIRSGVLTRQEYLRERQSPRGFEETFWRWMEEMRDRTDSVHLIGGEPLISEKFTECSQRLRDIFSTRTSQEPVLFLITTNLNVGPQRLEEFLSWVRSLQGFATVSVSVSMESYGERAEYIRSGLKWSRFVSNLETLAALGPPHYDHLIVEMIPTLSALCATSLREFLTQVDDLQVRHRRWFALQPNLVLFPEWISPAVLTREFGLEFLSAAEFAMANRVPNPNWREYGGFLKKLALRLLSDPIERPETRALFRQSIQEIDRRRGQSFLSIFPEYSDFYDQC